MPTCWWCEIDFTFFSGIMPWDHTPGALSAAGVLSAKSHDIWRDIHHRLFRDE